MRLTLVYMQTILSLTCNPMSHKDTHDMSSKETREARGVKTVNFEIPKKDIENIKEIAREKGSTQRACLIEAIRRYIRSEKRRTT
jgi:hypothetical protein